MEKLAQSTVLDGFPFVIEVSDDASKQPLSQEDDDSLIVKEDDGQQLINDDEFTVSEIDDFSQSNDDAIVVNLPEDSDELPEIIEDIKEEEENPSADGPKEYVFKLDLVPGADDGEDVLEDEEVNENPNESTDKQDDKPVDEWDWKRNGGVSKFLDWIQNRFTNVPKHSGKDTTGIERCIAYFQRLNAEISKAMREDYKREIDAAKAEEARSEIMQGMERLIDRLEKLNSKKFKKAKQKKANYDSDDQIVKNAETSITGKIVITVPYLISNIARACIEATVQGGKDIEDAFDNLDKKFELDKREKAQVIQLIKDMGYPMMLDRFKDTDISEYQTNYNA